MKKLVCGIFVCVLLGLIARTARTRRLYCRIGVPLVSDGFILFVDTLIETKKCCSDGD
jgi:hypothetical protein